MCVKLTEAALMQQRLNFIKGRIHSDADAEQLVRDGLWPPAGEYLQIYFTDEGALCNGGLWDLFLACSALSAVGMSVFRKFPSFFLRN